MNWSFDVPVLFWSNGQSRASPPTDGQAESSADPPSRVPPERRPRPLPAPGTGYQVWNRRARKKGHNRTNPPEMWVWSEEPAHPAIVTRGEYDAVQARAKANERSRQAVPATVARPSAKRDYLYRGLLRCGICGLRMWGNHRRHSAYYSCQPSHQRSKDIPAGHPPHVYLNEQRLNSVLLPFLATALFDPERTDYWRHALDAAAELVRLAPAKERASEIEAEIADLERRIGRQLVNLEADDVTPGLRRRIGERVAELEAAIADHQERLVALPRASATGAPTLADVAPLFDRLRILAGMLDAAPQGELRALFDALQLDVVFQPAESAVDVTVTLYDGSDPVRAAAQVRAEDWSVGALGRIRTCDTRFRNMAGAFYCVCLGGSGLFRSSKGSDQVADTGPVGVR